MHKDKAHQNVQTGIHVRFAPWGKGAKKNTCKPNREKGPRKPLRRARAALERRIIAHDATLKTLDKSVNPLSFRKPGSMKGH